MSLQTVFERRRFELFYGSLVLCGLSFAFGQLPALLEAGSLTDVSPFAVVLGVGGLALATTSAWEALHRDRAKWEAERDESGRLVLVVIGFGAMVAGALAYTAVAAV